MPKLVVNLDNVTNRLKSFILSVAEKIIFLEIAQGVQKTTIRETASSSSSFLHLVESEANKSAIILDYIKVHGKPILALPDSGITKTIHMDGIFSDPFVTLILMLSQIMNRGQSCKTSGAIEIPIQLKDKVILLEVLVVPSLPNNFILGVDFWSKMKIVPCMVFSGGYCRACSNFSYSFNICSICSPHLSVKVLILSFQNHSH